MDYYSDKILIIDDEPDILEIIGYNLKQAGYQIETASNGDEGIQKTKMFLPDLILLDVMMPEKDGHETIKILRQNPDLENTVIIFLTALSDERSEIEGLKLGADDYIGKPINIELLLARVKTALRRMKRTDHEESENKMIFGDLEINKYTFSIKYKDQEISLA